MAWFAHVYILMVYFVIASPFSCCGVTLLQLYGETNLLFSVFRKLVQEPQVPLPFFRTTISVGRVVFVCS